MLFDIGSPIDCSPVDWARIASPPPNGPDFGLPSDDRTHPMAAAFRDFVKDASFPCVGAKSALAKGDLAVVVARDIASNWNDRRIHAALLGFIARYRARPDLFQSFAVVFERDRGLDEATFERALWARLQSLAEKDATLGHPWDRRVATTPDNPHFSFSLAGEAFFVVGLHPRASRPARRFRAPALVFNLHDQFERLRAEGRYEKLRETILRRDLALAGTPNPMLSQHGDVSEARQYSGRAVSEDWRCPFRNPTRREQGGS